MAVYTTINDPEAYFQTKLYTGDGSTQSITFDGDTDMQPDFIWIKERSATGDHKINDVIRGTDEYLSSNSTAAADTTGSGIQSYDSDGFSISDAVDINDNTEPYVAWCWKESATAGFDIVAYDGVGVGTAQNVNHSLSAVPELYVVKSRESVGGWHMYHHKMSAAPETDYIDIDSTAAVADYTFWGDTAPTSSVFTVDDGNDVNESGEGFLCYLWRSVQGFSKFGSYTGNGDADGTFVYTGFKPAWIMIKRTGSAQSWVMFDNKRNPFNLTDNILFAQSDSAEQVDTTPNIDLLSNGWKIRHTDDSINGSESYIYMAFAEAPFVNSNGVPCNAR